MKREVKEKCVLDKTHFNNANIYQSPGFATYDRKRRLDFASSTL